MSSNSTDSNSFDKFEKTLEKISYLALGVGLFLFSIELSENGHFPGWLYLILISFFLLHSILVRFKSGNNPKSLFGKWVVNTGLPKYENNIYGFVYAGAAFLVLIIGLRGVGESIPPLFKNSEGRLDIIYILIALTVEFFMVMGLAILKFFEEEDDYNNKDNNEKFDLCNSLGIVETKITNLIVEPPKTEEQKTNNLNDILDEIKKIKTKCYKD